LKADCDVSALAFVDGVRTCLETYPSARDRSAAFDDKEIEAGNPEGLSMQIDAARRASRGDRS